MRQKKSDCYCWEVEMKGLELIVAEELYNAWMKVDPELVVELWEVISLGGTRKQILERIRAGVASREQRGLNSQWIADQLEQVVDYIIHQRSLSVHHIGGNPNNNDLLNLRLVEKGEHARITRGRN